MSLAARPAPCRICLQELFLRGERMRRAARQFPLEVVPDSRCASSLRIARRRSCSQPRHGSVPAMPAICASRVGQCIAASAKESFPARRAIRAAPASSPGNVQLALRRARCSRSAAPADARVQARRHFASYSRRSRGELRIALVESLPHLRGDLVAARDGIACRAQFRLVAFRLLQRCLEARLAPLPRRDSLRQGFFCVSNPGLLGFQASRVSRNSAASAAGSNPPRLDLRHSDSACSAASCSIASSRRPRTSRYAYSGSGSINSLRRRTSRSSREMTPVASNRLS